MKRKLFLFPLIVLLIVYLAGNAVPLAAQSIVPTPDDRNTSIVGGQPAEPGEWPWQAVVRAGPYACGGALLNREWVVTAAHCLVNADGTIFAPSAVTVRLGDYNRSQPEASEQLFGVIQVVVHEGFNDWTNDNDIALLQLAQLALITPQVMPIRPVLSDQNALTAVGTLATVTGWGATTEGGNAAAQLMEVEVPIVANDICNESYGIINDNMLCAGYSEGGKDSCQGDSGGPLVVPDGQGWRLAGIVSFGHGCARPHFYGVYTRIARYVAWIQNYTGTRTVDDETPTPSPTALPTAAATASATVTITASVTSLPTPTPIMTPIPSFNATDPVLTVVIQPDEPQQVVYHGESSQIAVFMPSALVKAPLVLRYQVVEKATPSANLAPLALSLAMTSPSLPQSSTDFTFERPFTIVITYSQALRDVGQTFAPTLLLYDEATKQWRPAPTTLLVHDTMRRRLTVQLTYLGRFALGYPRYTFYLPQIIR